MASVVSKVVHLSEERARRLQDLASDQGTSEDALVEKALDLLFHLREAEGDAERAEWQGMSESSLQRVWDNDADAVYDDWRRLYGIPEG